MKQIEWARLGDELYAKSGGFCFYCGHRCVIENQRHPLYFTVDHIVPKAAGGTNDYSNLLPCCRACNTMKHGQKFEIFFPDANVPERRGDFCLQMTKQLPPSHIVSKQNRYGLAL